MPFACVRRWEAELRQGGALPAPVDAIARLGAGVMRLGMFLRRMRRPQRVAARVVSIGNITAGGTGKTPLVIERVLREMAAGRTVAVLTRGYGARRRGETAPGLVVVRTDAERPPGGEWLGDEPELIARRAPGVIIARGADRVAGARAAIERFGADLLILDDGYQYLRLTRDENIVVLDAANPFGNGRVLPRGVLREPLSALRRAAAVVLTRCDQATGFDAIEEALARFCPDAPVRYTRHAPSRLWSLRDGSELPLDALRGARIGVACAIGRPEAFRATLAALGAEPTWFRAFPDHAVIPVDDLPPAELTLVTEKDAMRFVDPPAGFYALGVDLEDMPRPAAARSSTDRAVSPANAAEDQRPEVDGPAEQDDHGARG